MPSCVLSYAEADNFEPDLFSYDHELSERDLKKSPLSQRCIYCGTLTDRSEPCMRQDLFVCEHCGWWQLITSGGGWGTKRCEMQRGRLKEYPIDSLEVPLSDLRRYLKTHPRDVAHVNPTAFEHLMGECLRDKFDPCEVIHVGGTADRGIDLILVQLGHGPRLVQVKRRSDLTSVEGVQVVRELNGVLFRENIARGMVITTASRFTKAALAETSIWTPTGEAYDMKLLSHADVAELFDVEVKHPYQPWLQFLATAKV